MSHLPRVHPDAWIQTHSGAKFWPLEPDPEDVWIHDIAHALARINRFCGHTRVPYSVAQHSVWVASRVPREVALEGLLHDASEAYLADVAKPVKYLIPEFMEAEHRLERCIAKRFHLRYPWPQEVHAADVKALATEARDLLPGGPRDGWKQWMDAVQPDPVGIVPLPPEKAEAQFLAWFDILHRERTLLATRSYKV